MNKSQANLARIAQRVPTLPTPKPYVPRSHPRTVGTSLSMRVPLITPSPMPVRNRRAPRMTAAQRDSRGYRSDWSRSPYAPFGGWQ